MTPRQTIELKQSERRQRIQALLGKEDRTETEDTELETLTTVIQRGEVELRAAIASESDPETVIDKTAGATTEERERLELRGRCRVGNILAAALAGKRTSGPEAELQADLGFDASDIPTELWRRPAENLEARAITPSGAAVGVNMANLEPHVFAPSIAARLGIMFRSVPSGTYSVPTITTAPSSAEPKAKSAAADATAGALTVASATPKRVPARVQFALEDIAAFGNESFESGLREALQMNLVSSLDHQTINGDNAGANLNGLIGQLAAPTAQGALATWSSTMGVVADFIDGLWSTMLGDLCVAVNPAGYRVLAALFQAPTTSGANGEVSAASYLHEKLSDFFTNSRMPDTEDSGTLDKNATLIVARRGQPMLTTAVIPDWGRISIDDPYTRSAQGERSFTISAIVGDPIIVQPSAFALGALQVNT